MNDLNNNIECLSPRTSFLWINLHLVQETSEANVLRFKEVNSWRCNPHGGSLNKTNKAVSVSFISSPILKQCYEYKRKVCVVWVFRAVGGLIENEKSAGFMSLQGSWKTRQAFKQRASAIGEERKKQSVSNFLLPWNVIVLWHAETPVLNQRWDLLRDNKSTWEWAKNWNFGS